MSTDKNWDVTELSKEQLRHSPTWKEYIDAVGRCSTCGEMANALDPCCGAPIDFEGGLLSYEDLWNDIEDEMKEYFERDYDQEGKDSKL